jgi:hypothetical protein
MTKYLLDQLMSDSTEGAVMRRLCVIWNDFLTHSSFWDQIKSYKYKNDARLLVESDFRRCAAIADEWPDARTMMNRIDAWLVEHPRYNVTNDNTSAVDALRVILNEQNRLESEPVVDEIPVEE